MEHISIMLIQIKTMIVKISPVQRSHLKEIVLNILLDEILQSQQDMISLWEVDRTWFDLKLPHLSKVLPITMK